LIGHAQIDRNAKVLQTLTNKKAPDQEIEGFHVLSVATFGMEVNALQDIFQESPHLSA
jgi:hypothetical protein